MHSWIVGFIYLFILQYAFCKDKDSLNISLITNTGVYSKISSV